MNRHFSVWVPESKIMTNTFYDHFEEISKWGDERSPLDVILLDSRKHLTKYHFKFKSHCIVIGMINWMKQWLNDMRQRVVVDGDVSNCKYILCGVPQIYL